LTMTEVSRPPEYASTIFIDLKGDLMGQRPSPRKANPVAGARARAAANRCFGATERIGSARKTIYSGLQNTVTDLVERLDLKTL